jgi:hypothetical protein
MVLPRSLEAKMAQFGPTNPNKGGDAFADFLYDTTAQGIWGQNGLLGIVLGQQVAGINTIELKGVLVNGKPHLRCDAKIIVYLPDSIQPIASDVECTDDSGAQIKLFKFDVAPSYSVMASVFDTIPINELYQTYSVDQTHGYPENINWNVIKAFLDSILKDILTYVRECKLDVDCVFDKVWDRVVHNFCGGDCSRDCNYNCKWYDVACHGRKVDCERLKAQCKVCEAALDWAKSLVKAYILSLIGDDLIGDAQPDAEFARDSAVTSKGGCGSSHGSESAKAK